MRTVFKKNQIIVFVIGLMIIAAGYLNFTNGNNLETGKLTDSEELASIGDAKLVSGEAVDVNNTVLNNISNNISNEISSTVENTNTLEQLYKIKNVCHIHGSIAKWEELIFGHCDPGYPQKDFKEYEYNAYEIFERIYKGYIKDTKKQIERNLEFFNSINGVDEIYLFGLSFGDVDAPYFRHVFKICQQLKTINLNVFEAGQYDSIMTKLKEYGAKCDIKKWIVE